MVSKKQHEFTREVPQGLVTDHVIGCTRRLEDMTKLAKLSQEADSLVKHTYDWMITFWNGSFVALLGWYAECLKDWGIICTIVDWDF